MEESDGPRDDRADTNHWLISYEACVFFAGVKLEGEEYPIRCRRVGVKAGRYAVYRALSFAGGVASNLNLGQRSGLHRVHHITLTVDESGSFLHLSFQTDFCVTFRGEYSIDGELPPPDVEKARAVVMAQQSVADACERLPLLHGMAGQHQVKVLKITSSATF
ncbi:MAG: hypothetical protein PHV43_01505 [Candidatus Colwellbacteria bacterium]|nr:hypothetical protein [Candidatus Colwellbacteria bacterium]